MKKRKMLRKIPICILVFCLVFPLFCGALTLIDYHRFKNANGIIKPIITIADCECKCGMDRQIDGLVYSFTYSRSSEGEWEESVTSGSFHFPLDTEVLIHKEYQ
ncbi:MAG: hypothetical protein IKK51_03790 [Oscillospiraceae bacterium]|nr:hypothetical protein [Oscillospiraceae bacterium]